MPFKLRFWASSASLWSAAAALILFGSGRVVFASGQTPAPQQTTTPAVPPLGTPPSAAPTGPAIKLSADEAVRMALENNLGIQAERLAPQITTYASAQARAAYAPVLFSNFQTRSSTTPPGSFVSGSTNLTNESFNQNGGIQQLRAVGRRQLQLLARRRKAHEQRPGQPVQSAAVEQPDRALRAAAAPQLQDRRVRQQIETSQNNQVIADIGLRETVTITSQLVRNAYFDLIGALEGYKVSLESMKLAQESLKNNQTKVEVGTLAPIDIIEAEAEVASNEEAVINAEARIKSVEDRLRALILNPTQPDFWTTRIEPSDAPSLTPIAIDVEAAIANALANRTDIARLKKQLDNVDVNLNFARNQRMPGLDVVANYNVDRPGRHAVRVRRGQLPAAGREPVGPGLHRCAARRIRTELPDLERGPELQLSDRHQPGRRGGGIGPAAAAAGCGRSARPRAPVATSVRDAARQVDTNLKRVEATRKARDRAERRLEAEQKRMTVGLSTTFQLFQAQRDLARQRQQEVNAMIDYNRSVIGFESIQIAPAGGGGR